MQDASPCRHVAMRATLKIERAVVRKVPRSVMIEDGSALDWVDYALCPPHETLSQSEGDCFRRTALIHAAACWLDGETPTGLTRAFKQAILHPDPTVAEAAVDGLHLALYPPKGRRRARRITDDRDEIEVRGLALALTLTKSRTGNSGKALRDNIADTLSLMLDGYRPVPLRPATPETASPKASQPRLL